MTNEELALKAKTGDLEAVDQLWRAIKSLVAFFAKNYYIRYQERCDCLSIEVDDLIQVGYFAMLRAIDYYEKKDGYKFSAYLRYPLLRQFNKLTRSEHDSVVSDATKFEKRKVYKTLSLNAPITNSEDSTELGEMLPDHNAELALRQIEDTDYISKLHSDLDRAMKSLPERRARFIRQHFYQGQPVSGIAQEEQLSVTAIRRQIGAGLRDLRNSEHLAEYRKKQYARAYRGGFKAWYYSGRSIQESIVINIDEKELRSTHSPEEKNSIDDVLNQFL